MTSHLGKEENLPCVVEVIQDEGGVDQIHPVPCRVSNCPLHFILLLPVKGEGSVGHGRSRQLKDGRREVEAVMGAQGNWCIQDDEHRHNSMLGILLAGATTLPAPLPAGTDLVRIIRSSDGSRLTVDLRRRQKVSCFDADGPYSAACRVIRGRVCCETGGWLPPPYNRVEEEIMIRAVIDCRSRRFDRQGDGRGWRQLEKDAALEAIADQHCPASPP